MQVTLKVIGGKNDGREIKISVPEFIIGRGEQAHLRPSSDLISRKHCAIVIQNDKVVIDDYGSRNGTFVNDVAVKDTQVVKVGDVLRVGRLQFEMLIDHAKAGAKNARVQSIADAANRTASAPSPNVDLDDESITGWLTDPGDPAKDITETKQFRLDETTQMFPGNLADSGEIDASSEQSTDETEEGKEPETGDTSDSSSGFFGNRKKKKKAGKLPARPKFSSENSTNAADDVLKKFFNRR